MAVQWFNDDTNTKELPWSTEFVKEYPDQVKEEYAVTKIQLCTKGLILETDYFKGFFFKSSAIYRNVIEYAQHFAITKQDVHKKAPALKVELQEANTEKPNQTNLKVGIDTEAFVRIKLDPDGGKLGAYELQDYDEFVEQWNRKGSTNSNPLIPTDPVPSVKPTTTGKVNGKKSTATGSTGSGIKGEAPKTASNPS